MQYKGRYKIFDSGLINTYPVKNRINKVKFTDLIEVKQVLQQKIDLPVPLVENISMLAKEIIVRREKGQPVILFTGGHMVKNGLITLLLILLTGTS